MIVLVVNAGSTSLKVDVFDMPAEHALAAASVQRIGKPDAIVEIGGPGIESRRDVERISDHDEAIATLLDALLDTIAINAVGHRVVHGGEALDQPTLVDEAVLRIVDECAHFAPLHNPANLAGIRAAQNRLKNIPHIAVTDTGFHRTLPPRSYLYAIPFELYEEHGVRRYGFHGISHQYVAAEAAKRLERRPSDLRSITCHLGGGASVCAIDGGRSVATSMGMTPLEGLMMATRCGDLDPGVVLFLQQRLSMSPDELDRVLNRESGLLGISGVSRDMREILDAAAGGHERAALAVEMFCSRVRQYIGAYLATLGGADAVVFTGGIGENSAPVRAAILQDLDELGIELDTEANNAAARDPRRISTASSRIAALVIPTDEELQIAREVQDAVGVS